MFLEYFRWLVFAHSTVTSNAIPVFYNPFEFFQIFTRLYVSLKRPNFWSNQSYAVITKANLIDFRNIKINPIFTSGGWGGGVKLPPDPLKLFEKCQKG